MEPSKPRCATCGNKFPCSCPSLAQPSSVPGYWMYETSGKLRPVVENYINGRLLTPDDIAIMRAYLRQWIAGGFRGEVANDLRARIDGIVDTRTLDNWIAIAFDAGIDPL